MRRFFLLVFLLVCLSPIVFGFDRAKTIDLNGDGKPDNVTIQINGETGSYILKVNSQSIKGSLDAVDGFTVIDIDTSDHRKEIAVHTPGPSDDDVYVIYDYDGKNIKLIAQLARWPVFPGNGLIYVDDWMGFWAIRHKYQFDVKSRRLKPVHQEFYYVGIEATVQHSFPLLQTRDDASPVIARLKPNSKVLILLCDPSRKSYEDNWYLIKSDSGLLGWTREKGFPEKFKQLPYAD